MTSIAERLAAPEVLLIDGGTGTELERRGVPMHGVAWSGAAALTHAETLVEIHADFIRAGAEVVITNSFANGRYMLEAAGLGDRVRDINLAAVEAARAARDRAGADHEVWIAGSISHMAPAADSGRRPDLATAAASFREQAEILAEGGVDLIALEMMRDVEYAAAAVAAATATGLPVWVGFSCERSQGGGLIAGPVYAEEIPFSEAVAPVMAPVLPGGGTLLSIMHSVIGDTCEALEIAAAHWPGALGAYAHSGTFRMPHWDFDTVMTPEAFLAEARKWVALGARAVGGCCGIGPAHIRLLAERLDRRLPC